MADDVLLDLLVECPGRDTRPHEFSRQIQRSGDQTAALAYQLDLVAAADVDHSAALSDEPARETRSRMSVTS